MKAVNPRPSSTSATAATSAFRRISGQAASCASTPVRVAPSAITRTRSATTCATVLSILRGQAACLALEPWSRSFSNQDWREDEETRSARYLWASDDRVRAHEEEWPDGDGRAHAYQRLERSRDGALPRAR